MEQEYFGVSLEKLLTSGGQTLYMVAWSVTFPVILQNTLVPLNRLHSFSDYSILKIGRAHV